MTLFKMVKEIITEKPLKTRCPICGMEYEYFKEYKPKTCGSWACVHKYLHPELNKERS